MRLISNGGNLNGISGHENSPELIQSTIDKGFDIKVDLWLKDNILFTGSESPKFKFNINLLDVYREKLWLQCHDLAIIEKLYSIDPMGNQLNYFYLKTDILARTSKWYNIVRSEKPINGCVYMNPELYSYDYSICYGLISDNILNYK